MLASLKPVLSALILPPGGLLLLAAALGLLARGWRPARAGLWCVGLLLWLSSTQGFAVWLQGLWGLDASPAKAWITQAPPPGVQAVVVLGGGVRSQAQEWPSGQTLTANALERLHYGAALAQAWQLPLAFSGGKGWAGDDTQSLSEAQVAALTLSHWGQGLRWQDTQSRDTRENAMRMAEQLLPLGIRHVALVTHAWHMPRARADFTAAGFSVTPAAMAAITPSQPLSLRWLPSVQGMQANAWVNHEALGSLAAALGLLSTAKP